MFTCLNRRLGLVIALSVVAVLVVAVIPLPAVAQDDIPWPTNDWLTSTPEEQGVDSAKLLALLDEIERQKITLDSLLVIRHGYVVMDAYFWPFEKGMKHNLYSATKSFNSALVGVAMQQGYIQSVDQRVLDLLPEHTSADPGWVDVTLRHVLTMTTGADCSSDVIWHESQDWAQEILSLPMAYPAGKYWMYCSLSPQLLSSIVGEATGVPSADFARETLFGPLNIIDYSWPTDPEGNVLGPVDLMLTPHDMAKLGYLYLHEGRWGDQQIIPSEFVRESVCMVDDTSYCMHSTFGDDYLYGYQWWVPLTDVYSFAAMGHVDQLITAVPELDLVVVTTAHGIKEEDTDRILEYLVNEIAATASSEGALPVNTEARDQLEARIAALAQPQSGDAAAVPDVARVVSGRQLVLDTLLDFGIEYWHFLYPRSNPEDWPAEELQVRALRLVTGDDPREVTLGMEFGDGYTMDIAVGLDGASRTTDTRFGTIAAKGRWAVGRSDTNLLMEMYVVGEGRMNTLYLILARDPIQVTSKVVTSFSTPMLSADVRQ